MCEISWAQGSRQERATEQILLATCSHFSFTLPQERFLARKNASHEPPATNVNLDISMTCAEA
jgi:hypothetical protein